MEKVSWLIGISLFLSSFLAFAEEKEAVLILTTDNPTAVRDFEISKQRYLAQHYHVTELSALPGAETPATRQKLVETLSNLKGAKDLHIEVLGHGEIRAADSKKFNGISGLDQHYPAYTLPIPAIESKTGIPKNSSIQAGTPIRYVIDSDSDRAGIGLGDFREGIQAAKNNNPNLNTTIYALNCYGANFAFGLADMTNVQAFSGTRLSAEAFSLQNRSATDSDLRSGLAMSNFPQLFQDQLNQGKSYTKAQESAFHDWIQSGLNYRDNFPFENGVLSLPRSPFQEFFGSWCVKHTVSDSSDPSSNIVSKNASILSEASRPTQTEAFSLKDLSSRTGCAPEEANDRATAENTRATQIADAKQKAIQHVLNLLHSAQQNMVVPNLIKSDEDAMRNLPSSSPDRAALQAHLDKLKGHLSSEDFKSLQEAFMAEVKSQAESCTTNCVSFAMWLSRRTKAWGYNGSVDDYLVKNCTKNMGPMMDSQQTFAESQAMVACTVNRAPDPISGLWAGSMVGTFEATCNTLKKLQDYNRWDQDCIKRFSASASEPEWARLKNLVDQGNQVPFVSVPPSENGTADTEKPSNTTGAK